MMGRALHLFIEGVTETPLDSDTIRAFLEACPSAIGMTTIMGPVLRLNPKGWAGVVIIAESHIQVHTRGIEVFVDVFSCKPFSLREARKLAGDMLALQESRYRVLSRGWLTD